MQVLFEEKQLRQTIFNKHRDELQSLDGKMNEIRVCLHKVLTKLPTLGLNIVQIHSYCTLSRTMLNCCAVESPDMCLCSILTVFGLHTLSFDWGNRYSLIRLTYGSCMPMQGSDLLWGSKLYMLNAAIAALLVCIVYVASGYGHALVLYISSPKHQRGP